MKIQAQQWAASRFLSAHFHHKNYRKNVFIGSTPMRHALDAQNMTFLNTKNIRTKDNCMDPVEKTDLTLIAKGISEEVQSLDVRIYLQMNGSFVEHSTWIRKIVLVSSVRYVLLLTNMTWVSDYVVECWRGGRPSFPMFVLFSTDRKSTSFTVCDVLRQ